MKSKDTYPEFRVLRGNYFVSEFCHKTTDQTLSTSWDDAMLFRGRDMLEFFLYRQSGCKIIPTIIETRWHRFENRIINFIEWLPDDNEYYGTELGPEGEPVAIFRHSIA